MIVSNDPTHLSPIFLSVLLIIYLMIVELGNEKIKKTFVPIIIGLIAIFVIMAFLDVLATYN